MALACQNPSCDYEFHDSILDPHEAITEGFEPTGFWELHREAPDGFGTESLAFCSDDCAKAWMETEVEA